MNFYEFMYSLLSYDSHNHGTALTFFFVKKSTYIYIYTHAYAHTKAYPQ